MPTTEPPSPAQRAVPGSLGLGGPPLATGSTPRQLNQVNQVNQLNQLNHLNSHHSDHNVMATAAGLFQPSPRDANGDYRVEPEPPASIRRKESCGSLSSFGNGLYALERVDSSRRRGGGSTPGTPASQMIPKSTEPPPAPVKARLLGVRGDPFAEELAVRLDDAFGQIGEGGGSVGGEAMEEAMEDSR